MINKKTIIITLTSAFFIFLFKTLWDIKPVHLLYIQTVENSQSIRLLDRHGTPLMINYQGEWNDHDRLPLHQFPDLLVNCLIYSEDQNFYKHKGVDWKAKAMALWQNIKARRVVRGASTITEQVTQLLTNRPRTLWSKWLSLIESQLLEYHVNKNQILEFYLNQVPFASHRKGMVQGARHYFNRDLSTLTSKEMLALILLIKAPSALDLNKSTVSIEKQLPFFSKRLIKAQRLEQKEYDRLKNSPLTLQKPQLHLDATHFVSYLKHKHVSKNKQERRTTLDSALQLKVQRLLDKRILHLRNRRVNNGAVLVVNHQTGEVLSWVVAGQDADQKIPTPGRRINAVLSLRQPGSILKPFIYALALEKGWSASTLILDEPLARAVGNGLHRFRNYSKIYYGPVTVREALANSLNVPAVKTIQYVGVDTCLRFFQKLGFSSLKRDFSVYDEGLALGNGEVSLLELVSAYTLFAHGSRQVPLKFFVEDEKTNSLHSLPLSSASISIINDILSDPWARRWEFGLSSVLNFPVQTAIKTGTSTDYRDALIVGYNHKYIVAIWMGNMDNSPMDGVTGAVGPALTLRGIFSYLNRYESGGSLPKDPNLIRETACLKRRNGDKCTWHTEWVRKTEENEKYQEIYVKTPIKYIKPTPGLQMAIDPRIPLQTQKFAFQLSSLGEGEQAHWYLDDIKVGESTTPRFLWTLMPGHHKLHVIIYKKTKEYHKMPPLNFMVKG